jgi:hypothetical protein
MQRSSFSLRCGPLSSDLNEVVNRIVYARCSQKADFRSSPIQRGKDFAMIHNTDVKPLLDKLCIDLGFCLPAAESEKLFLNPPGTVLEFTNAVFSAEGLAPEVADRRLFRQVRSNPRCQVFHYYIALFFFNSLEPLYS